MDINEILSKLTLEQKILLTCGASMSSTHEISELGIMPLYMADGSNGLRLWNGKKATCYPSVSAQASTWNKKLSYKMGEILGTECEEKNTNVLLAPGMNIERNPLCGRNFEYYSEDVYLTWNMASEFIKGVQSYNVSACAKHFACNNQEFGARDGISSNLSERAIREVYTRTFQKVIEHSQPKTIMSSYNRLNGVYCSENEKILTQLLREEYKYNGTIISDWGAVHNKVNSIKAGLDLEMPIPNADNQSLVKEALNKNILSMEELDKRVYQVLKLINEVSENKHKQHVSLSEKLSVANQIAEESICLLKNESNTLPIKKDVKSILVIGELAVKPAIQGGGCAHVECDNESNPLKCLENLINKNVAIDYAQGYESYSLSYNGALAAEAVHKSKQADLVILFVGNPDNIEREVFDRATLALPNSMCQLCDDILRANDNVVFVIQAGGVIDLKLIESRAKAILFQCYAGEFGAQAIAKTLVGLVNPSGKITKSFVKDFSDSPSSISYLKNDNYVNYDEDILVGYKYFDYYNIPVMYPFGYGLSYTVFKYSDFETSQDGNQITTRLTITNSGERGGAEVVQLYAGCKTPKVLMAKKSLVAFEKVYLEKNESKEITFTITTDDLQYFNEVQHAWFLQSGTYELSIGANCNDIKYKKNIKIQNTDDVF